MQISRPVWKEAPFIRLLLPFIFGIIVSNDRHLPAQYLVGAIVITGVFIPLLNLPSAYAKFRIRSISGILLNMLLFFLGALTLTLSDIRNRDDWIGHLPSKNFRIIVRIEEPLVEKKKTFKTTASIAGRIENGVQLAASGKLILYLPKTDTTFPAHRSNGLMGNPVYGSELMLDVALAPITNSGSFDYKKYCALQHIYHQVFVKKGNYRVIRRPEQRNFRAMMVSIQVGLVRIMEKFVGGREAGLAEALLIGYKVNLDRSMLQEYSDSGIIHVVAISGMHLGLIYWMLSLLISIGDWKKSGWLKPLIILIFLWLFTLVAGASASVVRSAVMFSFLLIGESINRKASVYNTLSGSALLLLCFNPNWLWDLGFQLSYLAVLSIVIFMKRMYDLVYVKNKLLDNLWKMVATTLAAQVLTTPLTIFYFQRFPVYFLITNIVAIPLSSLVVLAEVILCLLAPLPGVAGLLGELINWLIALMNRFVVFMNTVPFGTITTDAIDKIDLSFIYLVIILTWFWLKYVKPVFLISVLGLVNAYLLCCN